MTRVALVDPSEMSEEDARAVVRSGDLNVFRTVANAPPLLRPWMRLGHRLLTETEIAPRLRELVILRVGSVMTSDYEIAQHRVVAADAGATAQEIAAVLDGDLAVFPPEERQVLELVGAAARDSTAGDAMVESVRAILGDRGIVELLLVTAHYMGVAMLLNVLDVDLDDGGHLQLTATR